MTRETARHYLINKKLKFRSQAKHFTNDIVQLPSHSDTREIKHSTTAHV